MSLRFGTAKVFAFFISIFVIVIPIAAQSDSIYRLPAGTRISLRMDGEIGSRFSSPNDTFLTRIAFPVVVRDVIMIPAGTVVEGRILNASKAAFGGKNGRLEFRMETLKFSDDLKRPIDGELLAPLKAKKPKRFWSIFGGTVIGGIVGAGMGSGPGAAIGAGIGTGAGAGFTFFRKGSEIRLKEDDIFEIELKKEVVLPVRDY
jgi:hypothetical protein